MLTRMHSARAFPLAIAIVAAVSTPSVCTSEARGDETESCIASHEQSQMLRKDGKLRAAREQMINCSRDVCPKLLRKECSGWMSEVDEAIPSVVIEAKGPDGQDLVEMKVTVDGQPLTDKLDGRAVNVDPGVHVFKFEIPKVKPREEKIVIREGQKARKIVVDFSPPKPATSATATSTAPITEPPPDKVVRPVPTLVYVLGGVGLVALGTSAFFEAKGLGQRSDLDAKGCKPGCPQEDVDAAKQSILIGDILLGAGVVSAGLATVFYFTRPGVKVNQEAFVSPVPGGGFAGFRGTF
jgi:hypothetical protein